MLNWYFQQLLRMPPWLRYSVAILSVLSVAATVGGAIALGGWLGWSLIALFSYIGPIFPVAGAAAFFGGLAGLTITGIALSATAWIARHKSRMVPSAAAAALAPAVLVASAFVPTGNTPPAGVVAPRASEAPTVVEPAAKIVSPVLPRPATVVEPARAVVDATEPRLEPSLAESSAARKVEPEAPPHDTATIGITGRLAASISAGE